MIPQSLGSRLHPHFNFITHREIVSNKYLFLYKKLLSNIKLKNVKKKS